MNVQSRSEVISALTDDFVARYRRGERPAISDYVRKLPECAAEIRDVLSAVALVENLAPERDASVGGTP